MEYIKELVSQKYSLWNVGINKAPCTQYGRGMIGWIDKTFDELVEEHNYNSKLWGMKMGLHENGKRTLSLDFDVCGDKNESTGERMGCPNTNRMLVDLLDFNPKMDGLYTSSTQGNMNVLIEYSQCPQICKLVERLATNKFQCDSLEILLGGNQVIPPSATKCKITNALGLPRAYVASQSFYVLNESSDCFVVEFLKELMTNKLQVKAPIVKPIAVRVVSPTTVVGNSPEHQATTTDDKYLDLLHNVIKNDLKPNGSARLNWDQWFQIAGILKYNGYTIDIWSAFCNRSVSNNPSYSTSEWDGIKNTTPMSIFGLQSIAKEINPVEYKDWLIKHNSYDLVFKPFTTGLIADYFIELHGHLFKASNEILYYYNGVYWETGDKKHTTLIKFFDKTFMKDCLTYIANCHQGISNQLLKLEPDDKTGKDALNVKTVAINKFSKNVDGMRTLATRTAIITDIITFSTNNSIKFDKNPYLFAFTNKVYDLKLGMFVPPTPEMYISKTTQYAYDEGYDITTHTNKLNELLNSIFATSPEMRTYYLQVLSTGLAGIQLENVFVATGTGGNGKSLFNSLMMETIGDYGYEIPSNLLLQPIKTGPNPEMYNLHNKRFAMYSEPRADVKICCATIKAMTGNPVIKVRDLYTSNPDGASMVLTLMQECNGMPLLDEVNQAMNRRLRAIVFNAKALPKDQYDELTEEERVGIICADPYLKTVEFRHTHRQALFVLLAKEFQTFVKNKYQLTSQPKESIAKCAYLLASSDNLYPWFEEHYEKCDDSTPITLTDVFNCFSSSEYYAKLSKKDQRDLNAKKFKERIETNMFLQKYVKRRKATYNGIQLSSDSIVGWRPIVNDEIITDCDM